MPGPTSERPRAQRLNNIEPQAAKVCSMIIVKKKKS